MCYVLHMHDSEARERVIETTGLRRTFTGRTGEVEAVAGVDLVVEAGTIFGFLGPNGAGKTTTLRMLTTLLPPTGGHATVAGFDLRSQATQIRARIGYVSQSGGSDHSLTGRAELTFQGRLYRLPADVARIRAAELVAAFELESCADRRIDTYSGGQRRRLEVALGLVHQPTILFLDEPTTGLDPQSRLRMWDEIARLRDRGTTVFLTTHYLEEADALCDRLAIIDRGRIVAQGEPDALKRAVSGDVLTIGVKGHAAQALELLRQRPFVRDHEPLVPLTSTLRLYVDDGETAMPAIFRILDGAGVEVRTASMNRPSLDDVFLRHTGRSLREEAA